MIFYSAYLPFRYMRTQTYYTPYLSGGDPQKPASPYDGFEPQPEHMRSPADSDLMTPLPASLSAPTTPHTMHPMQHWDSAPHSGFNPYFPQVAPVADAYDKGVNYEVVT